MRHDNVAIGQTDVLSSFAPALWCLFVIGSTAGLTAFADAPYFFSWLIADITTVIAIALVPLAFLKVANENKIFLGWSLIAMLSALWSLTPWLSFYHGLQLLMTTLIGFFMTLSLKRSDLLKVIFVAVSICQVLSHLYALTNAPGAFGHGYSWRGTFDHKNTFGSVMALQVLSGACLLLMRWRPMIVSAVLIHAVFLLAMSKAGTSIAALSMTLLLFPAAIAFRRSSRVFLSLAGLTIIAAVGLLSLIVFLSFDPSAFVLTQLGKDTTLSGRTLLWGLGLDTYLNHPVLGLGFKAYWSGEGTSAPYVSLLVGQELWFFHNNYLEVAVGMGTVGLVIFVLGVAIAVSRSISGFVKTKSYASLWVLATIVYIVAFTFTETPLFANHSFFQMLFFAVVASAHVPATQNVPAHPKTPPFPDTAITAGV